MDTNELWPPSEEGVWAAWSQARGLWALGMGREDGCWVGNLECSRQRRWSWIYTIAGPDEGSLHARARHLGFLNFFKDLFIIYLFYFFLAVFGLSCGTRDSLRPA